MQSPVVAVGSLDLTKLASVAPHVPLIRFRKGLEQEHQQNEKLEADAPLLQPLDIPPAVVDVPHVGGGGGGVLEWWQKPQKFRREPLGDQEIEVINGGGADVVFQ